MVVWISGPTGSGKSTLTRMLAKAGFVAIEERLAEESFRAFVRDPSQNCGRLQEEIMLSRYETWRALTDHSRLVFDRSIDEDIKVFCTMHRELLLLNEKQFDRLTQLSRTLQSVMPSPDLIVFMDPGLNALKERVTVETHPPLIVRNLERQISLYRDWIATRRENILRLDNSGCEAHTIRELFQENCTC